MVWADNRLITVALTFNEFVRTMLADVVEREQYVIVIANAEKLLASDLKGEVITRIGRLRNMACILPGSHEKPSTFLLVDRVTCVVRRIQGTDNSSVASLD